MITNPEDLHDLAAKDFKAACAKAKRYLKALPELRRIAGKVEQTNPEVAFNLALILLGTGVGIPPKDAAEGTVYIGTDLLTGRKYTRVVGNLTHEGFMRAFSQADPAFTHVNEGLTTHWVVMGLAPEKVSIVDENWEVVFVFGRIGVLA